MNDDFNKLQKRLTTAIDKFEANEHLQDVDGIVEFSKLNSEFNEIHAQLSFLNMIEPDVDIKKLTLAVELAKTYVKLSSDQLLACDGKYPPLSEIEHDEVKAIEPATKATIFDQVTSFFRRSPTPVNYSPVTVLENN